MSEKPRNQTDPNPSPGPKSRVFACPACRAPVSVGVPSAAGSAQTDSLWVCPRCQARFRLRRSSIEPPPAPSSADPPDREPPETAELGGLGLSIRASTLRLVRWGFAVGTFSGTVVLLPLGGFIPVLNRWLSNQPMGWLGVVEALGGVWLGRDASDPDSDLGPVLARLDAPPLFDDLAEIARKLGARVPRQVRLTFLPCCGVVSFERQTMLLIGLPLLHVLTRGELRAVLAHELAHLARGDASSSARSSRFVERLGQALDTAPPASLSPLRLWARLCRSVSDRLIAPLARAQEVRADRASAHLAGGSSAASALVKVALVQPLFREVLDHYDPARADLPNLYAFFRDFWARVPDHLHASLRLNLLADRRSGSGGVHPSLLDRLAVVQSYADESQTPSAQSPASTLLSDLEALEQTLHARLFATGRVEPSIFHRAGS